MIFILSFWTIPLSRIAKSTPETDKKNIRKDNLFRKDDMRDHRSPGWRLRLASAENRSAIHKLFRWNHRRSFRSRLCRRHRAGSAPALIQWMTPRGTGGAMFFHDMRRIAGTLFSGTCSGQRLR
jgi:hypothetical protein